MVVPAWIVAACCCIGLTQALVAARLVNRFARRPRIEPPSRPAVTVLKPLYGDEPLLEQALQTICRQDYPQWQVVFGVQRADDPAVAVVKRLRTRFPGCDIALVIDPTLHGENRKVGNLINMLPAARHDVLVIADSDVHVQPDYLNCLVAALAQPGVGLVTTLYAGLPASRLKASWPDLSGPSIQARVPRQMARTGWAMTAGQHSWSSLKRLIVRSFPKSVNLLGATQITHGFLPGAVVARALGRQDCLGATMCLRRQDLARCGGLRGLVDHLADDAVLGHRIAALGLRVVLADTVPLTTVPEDRMRALFRHELRWARTIRALEPVGFAASILQYSLAWALLAVVLAGGAPWSVGVFGFAWVVRAGAARMIDRALAPQWAAEALAAPAFRCPVWLLPARDLLSVVVMLASYGGRRVEWRGYGMLADTPQPPEASDVTFRPIEEINAQ
ncbi:MAG: glycosyltransferase [Rhodopila sp.]